MVVLLDSTPMSFLAVFAPAKVRFVGANNNIVQPGGRMRLAQQVEDAIRSHPGPLFGLEGPADDPGRADATLHYYRLRRAEACTPIRSNLNGEATKFCPLTRLPD
jgi:hypothetical protein